MARTFLFLILAGSALMPIAVLLLWSVSREWFYPDLWPTRLTLESWRSLLTSSEGLRITRAGVRSLGIATGCGAAAALIGLPVGRALSGLVGWRRYLGAAAAFLPIAAPPVAVAVGLQFSFLKVGLGGSLAGVSLAHLVPALGYTALFFLGVFTAFDNRVEEEATLLGARRDQVFMRVTLPLLRRPLFEAFLLGFLVSWAQVPLTLLVGQGAVSTLPLEVFAFVQAGQDQLAASGSLLLIVPPLVILSVAGLALRRAEVVAV